ncbi:hypothetical protein MMC09_004124 [Bachmanniomyces sp. S44760]|nr:hypothetical protein [Bachmanniomyces sp. S44760]
MAPVRTLQNLSLPLAFLCLASYANALSLSDFQQITGFSTSCTSAYNAPIPDCQTSDFTNGAPCSSQCVASLQTVCNAVDTACSGIEADPHTLIGTVFSGNGVSVLCPNVGSSSGSQGLQSSASSSKSSIPSSTSQFAGVASTASSSLTTSTSSITSSTSHPLTTAQPSTATPVSIGAATSSATTPDFRSFVHTAVDDGSATVFTNKAEQTASSNPDAYGGGGSPFEIANNANGNAAAGAVQLMFMTTGFILMFLMLNQ